GGGGVGGGVGFGGGGGGDGVRAGRPRAAGHDDAADRGGAPHPPRGGGPAPLRPRPLLTRGGPARPAPFRPLFSARRSDEQDAADLFRALARGEAEAVKRAVAVAVVRR